MSRSSRYQVAGTGRRVSFAVTTQTTGTTGMHKLSDASFKREGDDGETTVEGYLAIQPPEDQDYTAGRNIGAVVFVVKPEGDEPQPTTAAADDDDKESDKPQSQSQQRRNR